MALDSCSFVLTKHTPYQYIGWFAKLPKPWHFNKTLIFKLNCGLNNQIVRRSPPRHSPPQTFTTSDVHHPLCKIRRSPPQTFTTSDVHHLRHSPPQTFTIAWTALYCRLPWCKVVWTAGTFWMLGRLVNFSFGGYDFMNENLRPLLNANIPLI